MTQRLRSRTIAVLMVLTLGVAACGDADETPTTPTPAPGPAPAPAPAPSPTTASFSGTVANVTGARIAGATVRALDGPNAGQSAMTNASGEFHFESLQIANTNFAATSGGYNEARMGTRVDGTSTLDFVFTRALLRGVVRNNEGDRLSGASVRVLDGTGIDQDRSVATNSNGEYVFTSLAVSNVNLVAMAGSHADDRRGTFVNGTNTLDFVLERLPDEEEPGMPGTSGITIIASAVGATEWRFEAVSNETFVHYNWRWGDGSGSSMTFATEQHLYTRTGTYTVTVEAVRANGTSVFASIEIEVRN